MIIGPVGAELFNADGQMDRHDENNNIFRNLSEHIKDYR